jgi:hypothetical protein
MGEAVAAFFSGLFGTAGPGTAASSVGWSAYGVGAGLNTAAGYLSTAAPYIATAASAATGLASAKSPFPDFSDLKGPDSAKNLSVEARGIDLGAAAAAAAERADMQDRLARRGRGATILTRPGSPTSGPLGGPGGLVMNPRNRPGYV